MATSESTCMPQDARSAHLHAIDAPVCQVLCQERVCDHIILIRCIAVHISTMRCDGTQLDSQRVPACMRVGGIGVCLKAGCILDDGHACACTCNYAIGSSHV